MGASTFRRTVPIARAARAPRVAIDSLLVAAVVAMGLTLAGCATSHPGPAAPFRPETGRQAAFLQTLDALRTDLHVPGLSYAVLADDRVVVAGGLGFADVERKIPAAARTRYPIASLTKPLSAVVLLQLAAAGKLDLDAPMAEVLKETRFEIGPGFVLNGFAARCAHIQRLAKLDDPSVAAYRSLFTDYRCDSERITVRHHLTHTAQGVPGRAYRYNGFLYGLLAQVAEAASGESFRDLLRERITGPLAMRDTTFSLGEAPVAQSYRTAGGVPVPVACEDCKGLNAGSGVVSTVEDLARFAVAVEGESLLPADARRGMFTPARSNAGVELPYAEGWFVERLEGVTLHWHYGYLPGAYSGLLLIVPESHAALVLLANSDGLSAGFDLDQGNVLRSPFARAFLQSLAGRTGPRDAPR